MLKKSLLGLVAAGVVAVSFTGCGNSEPEGIYQCIATENGETKDMMKLKFSEKTWDAQMKDKWMSEEISKKLKESETTKFLIMKKEKTYMLKMDMFIKGKKKIKDFIDFSYNRDKDTIDVIIPEGQMRSKDSSMTCSKVK